ncbi:MAG TPA: phosphatidylserine decarboxylase [Candidatus Poseidoniales archaeon]|nr:phosphatidylserine decarboxylase [Candidatus Poseidoniales archaeon]
MAMLARGGLMPVITPTLMGCGFILVGWFVDPLFGLAPAFGILTLMLAAFFANFWRDPDRPIPKEEGLIVSPADGHVMFVKRERAIGRRPSPAEMDDAQEDEFTGTWHQEPCEKPLEFSTEQRFEAVPAGEEADTDVWRVAVFMSPLDVHVNRAPIAGTITRMEHRTGKGKRRGPFLPAFRKESEFNERVRTLFERADGLIVEVMQISGALARTIIPWSGEGDQMRRGQRFGMIRLGSRVDVRVPATRFEPCVISAEADDPKHPKGEFVQAGSTILYREVKA